MWKGSEHRYPTYTFIRPHNISLYHPFPITLIPNSPDNTTTTTAPKEGDKENGRPQRDEQRVIKLGVLAGKQKGNSSCSLHFYQGRSRYGNYNYDND